MSALPQIGRRAFLGGGLAASLSWCAGLRALPASAETLAAASPERFFSQSETEILTQIVERMVDTGVPEAPPVRKTRAIETLDQLMRHADPAISGQLPLVLALFEWGPFVFDLTFSRFTRMTDAEKDASIRAWMTSSLTLRRMAFTALRNLAFLGYYSQDETWPLIGYRGPLLARRTR